MKASKSLSVKRAMAALGAAALLATLTLSACRPKLNLGLVPDLTVYSDTIQSGEERPVFLTDGTGGYYFASAERSQDWGEFGYNRLETRFLAGWQVFAETGEALDERLEFTLVHPLFLQRTFSSDLVETVAAPRGKPGMLLTLVRRSGKGLSLRPSFDIRRIQTTDRAEHQFNWNPHQRTLTVSRQDSLGGFIAAAVTEDINWQHGAGVLLVEHHFSRLIGTPAYSWQTFGGDFITLKGDRLLCAFGWGKTAAEAQAAAVEILETRDLWRAELEGWTHRVVSRVMLSSGDEVANRALAWGLLTLASLETHSSGERFLLTGLPFSPWAGGLYTSVAAQAILSSGVGGDSVKPLLRYILKRQNREPFSPFFGRLPSAVHIDSVVYRLPIVGGAIALAGRRLDQPANPDSAWDAELTEALATEFLAVCRRDLKNGLVYGDTSGGGHLLYDGAVSPVRRGANIENQTLLHLSRDFLRQASGKGKLTVEVPSALLTGSASVGALRSAAPLTVASGGGLFNIPLDQSLALSLFYDRTLGRWAGSVMLVDTLGRINPVPAFDGSAAAPIALGWLKGRDGRTMRELLDQCDEDGLTTDAGFRTLSPRAPEYNSAHEYGFEEAPRGSLFRGDVWLWSAGRLGDMLALLGESNRLHALTASLTRRLMKVGAAGALHEAENAEAVSSSWNIVGDVVHLGATAEYVRLMCENVLGVESPRGGTVTLRPRIPESWGATEFSYEASGGRIFCTRLKSGTWVVKQLGIEPSLQLALDVEPAPGERALTSLRLYPGDSAQVHFIKQDDGHWQAKISRVK